MILSSAPIWLILSHFKLNYLYRFSSDRQSFKEEQDSFCKYCENLQLDYDWFTSNIPTWLMAFKKQSYNKKTELNCLEIGSWQGQSAVFLLSYFEKANLTCVDTWEGGAEHKSEPKLAHAVLSAEKKYDANLSGYEDRLIKYKGSSFQYFNDCFERDKFDLIYIDGSHHADDLMIDAIKSFEMLKMGGVIIFDDYFWKHYTRTIDNPSGAINAFVRLKSDQLKVICFNYQLVVRKTNSSVR